MHQDYCEGFSWLPIAQRPGPMRPATGEICVKRLAGGERGTTGPHEHAQYRAQPWRFPPLGDAAGPHHGSALSFDVQSMRYTAKSGSVGRQMGELELCRRCLFTAGQAATGDRTRAKEPTPRKQRQVDLGPCAWPPRSVTATCWPPASPRNMPGASSPSTTAALRDQFTLRALLQLLDLRAMLDAQLEIASSAT